MPEERSPILSSIQNIFSIPDLRKRVLFMLAMLAVYRVGAFITTPGINNDVLEQIFEQQSGTILGFLNMFTGGALRRFSIFALGIMPYITASIILQLATVVVPFLEKLSKEGELGRKKITQYTRYLTVALTLFQGFMTAIALEKSGSQIVLNPGWGFRLMVMITLTTGTAFIMWVGVVVDKHCHIPAGMSIGFDPAADAKRFHVTAKGITLVTPDMLGQHIHEVR